MLLEDNPLVKEHLARDTPYLAWLMNDYFNDHYSKGVCRIGTYKTLKYDEKVSRDVLKMVKTTPPIVRKALKSLRNAEIEIFFGSMPEGERQQWRDTFPTATFIERGVKKND